MSRTGRILGDVMKQSFHVRKTGCILGDILEQLFHVKSWMHSRRNENIQRGSAYSYYQLSKRINPFMDQSPILSHYIVLCSETNFIYKNWM